MAFFFENPYSFAQDNKLEEITMDKKHFGGKLKKVEELVEKVIEEII